MYEAGDKLVCVKSGPPSNNNTSEKPLVKGAIYVVRQAEAPRWEGDYWGIRVVGNRTFSPHGIEVWWHQDRFRKLSDMQAEAREKREQKQPAQ